MNINNNIMDINEKRDLLRRLKAKEVLDQDKVIREFKGSPVQQTFLMSNAKVRIVEGANRSGKTEVCAVDTLIQLTGIIPDQIKDLYPREFIRPGRYWVSSLRYAFSRDVAKPKVDKYLPERLCKGFNKAANTQYLEDGSEIGYKSMDSGRDAYAGDSRLQVWLDEEHTEEVYKEAYMRTIDCRGRMVMSFTPVEGLTWAYNKLYKKAKRRYYTKNKHGIKEDVGIVHTQEELEKLRDRELFSQENTDADADPNVEIFQMTIYDNIHLPLSEIQNAERENKDDLAGYQARILGIFAKISGSQVYSVDLILKGKAKCPNVFDRGTIESGRFVAQKDGRLVVFKKKKPAGQGNYVIGADIAEGLEKGDFSCAQVIDHNTCEQVAVWHGKVPPEEFALILIELGKYYNYAWLLPERNFHGFAVVNRIRDQKYPRLYCDDNPDLRIDKVKEQNKYGWETNARTKPIMVQDLGEFLSQGHVKINDPNTWDEIQTYVYLPNGKTGAMKGCFDDRAVALMIALQGYKTRRPKTSTVFNKGQLIRNTTVRPDPHTNY